MPKLIINHYVPGSIIHTVVVAWFTVVASMWTSGCSSDKGTKQNSISDGSVAGQDALDSGYEAVTGSGDIARAGGGGTKTADAGASVGASGKGGVVTTEVAAAGSGGAGNGGSTAGSGTRVCESGDTQCNGKTPQTCNDAGQWKSAAQACTFACADGECTEGECEPGDTQCIGNIPQTCNDAGEWVSGQQCSATCDDGECTESEEECEPEDTQCIGNIPQTCSDAGQWVSGQQCSATCDDGECTESEEECKPGDTQCIGNIPQTCNDAGEWVSGQQCSATCDDGECDDPNEADDAIASGTWSGTTNQSRPIELDVNASGTTISRIEYSWSAAGCGATGTAKTTGTIPVSGSSFSNAGGFCPRYDIKGTFNSATSASGTLKLTYSGGGPACPCTGTENITWTASAP